MLAELKQAMLALEELPLILTGHTRRADELTSAADALDGAIAKRQEEVRGFRFNICLKSSWCVRRRELSVPDREVSEGGHLGW